MVGGYFAIEQNGMGIIILLHLKRLRVYHMVVIRLLDLNSLQRRNVLFLIALRLYRFVGFILILTIHHLLINILWLEYVQGNITMY